MNGTVRRKKIKKIFCGLAPTHTLWTRLMRSILVHVCEWKPGRSYFIFVITGQSTEWSQCHCDGQVKTKNRWRGSNFFSFPLPGPTYCWLEELAYRPVLVIRKCTHIRAKSLASLRAYNSVIPGLWGAHSALAVRTHSPRPGNITELPFSLSFSFIRP